MTSMLDKQAIILEAVAAVGEPVTAGDIARITDLPRATCYRLVNSLAKVGFLESEENDGYYLLGMRFVKIALLGKSDNHVRRAVSGIVERLVMHTGETGFFSRYRGGRVDLIHIETPKNPKSAFIYPGTGTRPAHACSSAKAIAAFAPKDILEQLIDRSPDQFTARTRTKHSDILLDLADTKARGYAVCDGEVDEGVYSVAVPIIMDRLGAVFSLGVVGPTKRIKSSDLSLVVSNLKEAAVRASSAIQHCSIIEAELLQQDEYSH